MKNDVQLLLTVNVITYNQEKYIRKCIESILSQKTDFDFIIKIFDDCSTDGTTEICQEYANKYPGIIKFYPAEKNLGATENPLRSYKNIESKYYMYIEGDDYCCDNNKLQLQVDILENHPNCSFCAHQTLIKNINDKVINGYKSKLYNEMQKGTYNLDFFRNEHIWNPHISSKIVRTECIDISKEAYKHYLLDITQTIMLIQKGDMYFLDDTMTVYQQTGEGIWSSKNALYRVKTFSNALFEYNNYSKGTLECSIYKIIGYYINYIFENEKEKYKKNELSLNIKKIKHYLFPRFLLDIFNIPRDISRVIRKMYRSIYVKNKI